MPGPAAAPQLTFRAVVLAIVLAVVLSAANAYLGLFAGLTVATAIPAAVVSMGVLRLLGGGTILENNIVQTGASAGSSIAAGVIFTIPALVLMGYWPDFKYWWVLGIAGLGGLLGVLFSVPLRRSMIVEDPLPFPEGKAAAEVLKAGENPGPGLKILGISAAIGAVVKLAAANGLRAIPDSWAVAGYFANNKLIGYLGTGLSPALLGVGYIVGLNVGIVVLSGAILSWHIAIPLYHAFFLGSDPALAAGIAGAPAADAAFAIWSAKIRFLGVGAMLVGGVWTLFSLRNSLLAGIRSGFAAARKGAAQGGQETDRDLPMKWMLVALVLFVLPLLALYQAIVGQWHVSVPMTLIMIVAGFLFVSVSGYLAGLVGSSNNPVSGITIATILFASVVLLMLLGADGQVQVNGAPLGAVAAIMIGAVVCCAAAVGGDNLQDLKTGYLVGATPWKQQLMLGIGAFSCALVMAPVLNLLQQAYGIGSKTLPAPQANLMASVAKGLFGGQLPWTMIAIGGVIGALVIALDGWLKARGSRFRVPVLAAAIGIYLPLELMVPIFLGGLLAHLVERFHKVRADDEAALDRVHRPGVLFSAGLITGEALMGIAIALPIVITQDPEVLALPFGLGAAAQWVGLAVLALVGWLLYRVGKRGERAEPAA
ncbi:oligopeptide transporter, OPT family [Pseudoxanthomonas jiangsuensis]|uniref:OPT family oligopeptide transporter n=1 Tax=Pseudoxanthomonas jiangsuensis TaxID=619688 RepID=UPI001390E11E|nr:oligopeptide transporter, OPT family [Pseudoxanthomonas jiangsuensis]KAF1691706.1 oligopeptide transporter, OPT family [Pseudoxanthomonas jiangsuensis]